MSSFAWSFISSALAASAALLNVLSPPALITSVFAASNALPNPRPFHALCYPSGWLSNTRCGPSATPTAMRMVPS